MSTSGVLGFEPVAEVLRPPCSSFDSICKGSPHAAVLEDVHSVASGATWRANIVLQLLGMKSTLQG